MAVLGLLFALGLYYPLRNRSFLPVIIATIGASIMFQNGALAVFGPSPEKLRPVIEAGPTGGVMLGGVFFDYQYVVILGVTLVLVVTQYAFFEYTLLGKKMQATSQDKDMARLLGIPVTLMIALTFIYSTALGGLAGMLVAPIYFVTHKMGAVLGLKAFAVTIAGGFGDVRGAIAGGLTLGGIDWWFALPLGLGAATAAGVVLGMTTLKLGGHYLAMVTICFQIIFSQIATNWVAVTGGPDGISGIRRPRFFTPLDTAQQYAWFALGALFLVGVGVWFLRDSALGRSMRAVRENELAAEALGVDSLRVKVTAFALSAAIAALGGALYASGFRYISPDSFGLDQSIEVLAMALAGGADAVPGSIVGGFLLTFLPEWLRDLKRIYLVAYGAVIILVILFMPEGLWGWARLVGPRLPRPPPLPPAARPRALGGEAAGRERGASAVGFVGLEGQAAERRRNLPYGPQKLGEIARALAGTPELLLLDAPGAGLNQSEKQELVDLLKRLRAHGLTMLLVEHDMSLVTQLSEAITVLNFGKKISEGKPDDVLADPVVVEAYLGNRDAALGLAREHA